MRQVLTIFGMLLLHTLLHGQNNDCNIASVLCDGGNIIANPSVGGFDDFISEKNYPGCLVAGEHQSEWYYFQIDPNAPPDQEIGFLITPNAGTGEDYDFALFGPNVDCNTLGHPIRCSYAAVGCTYCPSTGMDANADDNTEGANGDGIVKTIIVQPGEGYFLLIDNFLISGEGFNMEWVGGAALWLDCEATPPCSIDANAGADIVECQGVETISLMGTNPGQNLNTTFTWSTSGIGNDFINDDTLQNPTLNIPSDFSGILNYTFTVEDGTCTDEAQLQIVIAPSVSFIVPQSTDFCFNQPSFPFPISPEGGTWNSQLPDGIVDPETLGVGVHSAIYTYTDPLSDCVFEEEINFTILPEPDVGLENILTQCVGNNPIALVGIPSNGIWSSNVINGILDPNEIGAGVHNIEYTITDPSNGCTSTAIQTVEILKALEIDFLGRAVFCINENTNISIEDTFTEYLWSNNSTSDNITVSSTGIYEVTVTNDVGCTASDQIYILEDGNFPIADAGSDQILDCRFNPISIGGNSSLGDMSYFWTTIDSNLNIENNNNIHASVEQAGTYQLLVTNNYNGCTAIDEMTVTENTNLPTNASFEIDPLICFGDHDASLTILNVQNGTPPYSYSIDQGSFQNNNTFPFLSSNTYSITVRDANFCEWQTNVDVPSPPEFSLNLGSDITISLGDEAHLKVQPNYALDEFSWRPDSTLPCIDCLDQYVDPIKQTTYFASATSEEGCDTEDFITIFVKKDRNVFIPNIFSPNGDGQNDLFKIYGGKDVLKINSFHVFNRWGDTLYEATDFDVSDDKIGWNGLLKGKELPQAVYVYFVEVEFIDGWKETYRGDVTLIR